MSTLLDKLIKETKSENRIFVDLNLDIKEQILHILMQHPEIKTKTDLAEKLGIKKSQVSRMLSGLHNLTIETIAKVTAVVGRDIIMTDLKAQEKYPSVNICFRPIRENEKNRFGDENNEAILSIGEEYTPSNHQKFQA